MDLLRRGLVALGLRAAAIVATYVSLLVLGRSLAAVDYGRFVTVLALVTLGSAVMGLGMPMTLLRCVGEEEDRPIRRSLRPLVQYALFWSVGLSAVLMTVSMVAIVLVRQLEIGALLGFDSFEYLIFGLLLLPGFVLIEVQGAVLRGAGRLVAGLAPRDIVWRCSLIPAAVVVSTIFDEGKQFFPLLLMAVVMLLVVAIWQGTTTWRLPVLSATAERAAVGPAVGVAVRNIWITNVAAVALGNIDIITVAILQSTAQAGAYVVASRSAALVAVALNAVTGVFGPLLSAAHVGGDRIRLRRILSLIAALASAPAVLVTAVMVFAGRRILEMFGPQFVEMYPVLVVLCVGQLVNCLTGSSGLLLNMTGRQSVHAALSLGWLMTAVVSVGVFAPLFGPIGVASAVAVASVGLELSVWWAARCCHGVDASILALISRRRGGTATLGVPISRSSPVNMTASGPTFQPTGEGVRQNSCLLYVCGFVPNPNAMSSGQKLAYRQLEELGGVYDSIRVVYFVNHLDALDDPDIRWPEAVDRVWSLKLNRWNRLMGMARWPVAPGFVSARRWTARHVMCTQLVDRTITDYYADFSQGLGAVPPQFTRQFVFRQHDIVSRLYGRKVDASPPGIALGYMLEAWRTRRWERWVWSEAKQVETLSNEDAEDIHSLIPHSNVTCVPVKGTLFLDQNRRNMASIVPGRIGFWGNMARHENGDAATYFVLSLLPEIRRQRPDAHLYIIGAHPTDKVRQLEGEYVTVTGFVDDPSELFASLEVAVAPLRLGSGVKIKVIETIEAGVPTVVTHVGGEGIPAHGLLDVAASEMEFVDLTVARMNSATVR